MIWSDHDVRNFFSKYDLYILYQNYFTLTTYPFSHPEPYKAYFLANSDPEFCVTPQTGELRPRETNGSLIQVDFLPTVYGKLYQGKLIVQVGAKAVCT